MLNRPFKPDRDCRRAAIAEQIDRRASEQDEAGATACAADREPTARERRLQAHAARIAAETTTPPKRLSKAVRRKMSKAATARQRAAAPGVATGSGESKGGREAGTRQNRFGEVRT